LPSPHGGPSRPAQAYCAVEAEGEYPVRLQPQPAAIRAAGLVVDRAITGIVAILNNGADFKPHTKMMAETTCAAFWNSMPAGSKKGQ
jgi:hypothetical protein